MGTQLQNKQSKTQTTRRDFAVVIVRCPITQSYVGHIPGWDGAYCQAETIRDLKNDMKEITSMLLEEGEPKLSEEFVGVETISIEITTKKENIQNNFMENIGAF